MISLVPEDKEKAKTRRGTPVCHIAPGAPHSSRISNHQRWLWWNQRVVLDPVTWQWLQAICWGNTTTNILVVHVVLHMWGRDLGLPYQNLLCNVSGRAWSEKKRRQTTFSLSWHIPRGELFWACCLHNKLCSSWQPVCTMGNLCNTVASQCHIDTKLLHDDACML